mgnify:CR=1 FL=1
MKVKKVHGVNKSTANTNGLNQSDNFELIDNYYNTTSQKDDGQLVSTQTYYKIENMADYMNKEYSEMILKEKNYWLASRVCDNYNNQAYFGLSKVYDTSRISYHTMCISGFTDGGGINRAEFGLRPIVTIKNVKINACEGNNNENNMHTISLK